MPHCDFRVRWNIGVHITGDFEGGTSAERSLHEQFLVSYEFPCEKCSVNLLSFWGAFPMISRLSGPIRANRFSLRKSRFLRIDLPKYGIAARIGRKSCEVQCESEKRRDSHESGQVLQK